MKELTHFIKHLKIEAFALGLLMAVLTYESSVSMWVLPATFLFFDIGMVGYLKNPRLGARLYNYSHNLTAPTLLIAFGVLSGTEYVSVAGYCWSFHIAVDRALGYGLKMKSSFHHTHLGIIKKNQR